MIVMMTFTFCLHFFDLLSHCLCALFFGAGVPQSSLP